MKHRSLSPLWLLGSLLALATSPSASRAPDPEQPQRRPSPPRAVVRPPPGNSLAVTVQVVPSQRPRVPLSLEQNGPNPFSTSTAIQFSVPEAGPVSLRVYDSSGREVVVLVDGSTEAGIHLVPWDGRDTAGHKVASGVYLYRLVTNGRPITKKMLLIR